MVKISASFLLILIFSSLNSISQTSGREYHRAGVLAGADIMTVFGNWSVVGQPYSYVSRGAWMYPTDGYIGDMSIMVGLELPVKDYNGDGIADTVHSVITCPVTRPTSLTDTDPVTGKYWTFEPQEGYFNSLYTSPALSDSPQTWPASWPDHPEYGSGVWNGLFGPGLFAGAHETYFMMDDQSDSRFNYAGNNPRHVAFKPDSSDTSRNGQGICVGVRYILFSDPMFKDVMFRVFDIKNVSSYRYSKVVFGNLSGTYIGVTGQYDNGEWDDDAAVYFSSNDFILAWDFDNNTSRNPRWVGPVGKFGEAFLAAPGSGRIASYYNFTPAGSVRMGDDSLLWKNLTPGNFWQPRSGIPDTVPPVGDDMDYLYGSDYFALNPGESRRIASVLSYGYNKDNVLQRILLAKALWNSRFNIDSMKSGVALTSFTDYSSLSGVSEVTWHSPRSGGSLDFWFSPDAGGSWLAVAKNAPNTGGYSWNTSSVPDCPYGIYRIFVRDTMGNIYGFSQSRSYLTINNTDTAVPFVKIMNEDLAEGSTITLPFYDLNLLAGDSKFSPVTVQLYYKINKSGVYKLFETYGTSSDSVPQVHSVNLQELPNSENFSLKVLVSDSLNWAADSTLWLIKNTPRGFIPQQYIEKSSGPANVPLEVRIMDSSKVKPDTYILSFNDTLPAQKTFSVYDQTAGAYVLINSPLYPRTETESFDGLVLYAQDFRTFWDRSASRWNDNKHKLGVFGMVVTNLPRLHLYGYAKPNDYKIVFYDSVADTSRALATWPFDTAFSAKFRIFNIQTAEKIQFALFETEYSKEMLFLDNSRSLNNITWNVPVDFEPPDSLPHSGDTLYLFTQKGLSVYDTLKISGIVLGANDNGTEPNTFRLFQNYPNPFNPMTQIRYQLPYVSRVNLSVFNLLGQEVKILESGVREAGVHTLEWDGTSESGQIVASGVYFCRIQAAPLDRRLGNQMMVNKMVILR